MSHGNSRPISANSPHSRSNGAVSAAKTRPAGLEAWAGHGKSPGKVMEKWMVSRLVSVCFSENRRDLLQNSFRARRNSQRPGPGANVGQLGSSPDFRLNIFLLAAESLTGAKRHSARPATLAVEAAP